MAIQKLHEFDVIFISYDEANCEENYADLLEKVPWAKRVHGVRGSDAAHKAAAELSETDYFIGIDGDNIVDADFFDQEIDLEEERFLGKTMSWAAKNEINGLVYGNGGLKLWNKEHVVNMRTHEAAPEDATNAEKIEFCWDDSYVQMKDCFCTTHPNGSPLQAFRAGFREGVKMTLDQGNKVEGRIKDTVWHGNYTRLLVWQTVGADVKNGLWAIYGARLGTYMTYLTEWDYINVMDFEWINEFFENEVKAKFSSEAEFDEYCTKSKYRWSEEDLVREIENLGIELRSKLGMDVGEFDSVNSRFFKTCFVPPVRKGYTLMTEEEAARLQR